MTLELFKIRQLFREFYGLLPILELSQNMKLVKSIEDIEKQLQELVDE